jgi:hypothetical protein
MELPLLALEDWVLVADRADRLKARGDSKHCRFRQPGGDDLHTDRKTVVVCSEPHRQGRQAGQAERCSRSHHMEGRYCLAIDHEIIESMFCRWERSHWAEQCIVAQEVVGENVTKALHGLLGKDEVRYRRFRCVKNQFEVAKNLYLVAGGDFLEFWSRFQLPQDADAIGLLQQGQADFFNLATGAAQRLGRCLHGDDDLRVDRSEEARRSWPAHAKRTVRRLASFSGSNCEAKARAIFAALAGAQLMARSRADLSLFDALIASFTESGLIPA